MTNSGIPSCCGNSCGTCIPLIANGSYKDPSGVGKTHISFNLSTSQECGISVARVLRGDLSDLVGRDDLAMLNPKLHSVRLRIEVSNPSPAGLSDKLTRVDSGQATKFLLTRSV